MRPPPPPPELALAVPPLLAAPPPLLPPPLLLELLELLEVLELEPPELVLPVLAACTSRLSELLTDALSASRAVTEACQVPAADGVNAIVAATVAAGGSSGAWHSSAAPVTAQSRPAVGVTVYAPDAAGSVASRLNPVAVY
jgi:hypothetical protein